MCSTLSLGTGVPRPRPNPATPNPPRCPVKAEHAAAGALAPLTQLAGACSGGALPEARRQVLALEKPPPTREGRSGRAHPQRSRCSPSRQVSRSPRETAQGMQAAPGSQQPCVDGGSRVGKGPEGPAPGWRNRPVCSLEPPPGAGATALLTPFLSEWVTVHLARLER